MDERCINTQCTHTLHTENIASNNESKMTENFQRMAHKSSFTMNEQLCLEIDLNSMCGFVIFRIHIFVIQLQHKNKCFNKLSTFCNDEIILLPSLFFPFSCFISLLHSLSCVPHSLSATYIKFVKFGRRIYSEDFFF